MAVKRETLSTNALISEIMASMMFGALTFVMLIDPITVRAQEVPGSSRF